MTDTLALAYSIYDDIYKLQLELEDIKVKIKMI